MTPDEFLKQLATALDDYRFDDVGSLIGQIDPPAFTDEQVKRTLGLLRRKRLFAELEKAAGLFLLAGHEAPVVRRQWAQALLDQNRVAQGLSSLELIAQKVKDDPEEGPEIRGLIGRAHKQLYVNEDNPEDLQKAVRAYGPGWRSREGDYRWHGINMVALLARARRDDVDPGVPDRESDIAREILGEITDLGRNAAVWDYGTAMEASIALGDDDEALKWARRYGRHPGADAFELGSTLRQMKEVWQLKETDIGKKLLPVLEHELLQRKGAVLELTSTGIEDSGGFEAIYGDEGYIHLRWMDSMYKCCTAVARVMNSVTGEIWGTGFLLKGSDLCEEWGDECVFVTNAHVISEDPANEAPLRLGEAAAQFTRLPTRPEVSLGELLFTSPKAELDVSVLGIEAPDGAGSLEPTAYRPVVATDEDKPQRIYVVGHPNREELTVTLYDNNLVGYEDDRYVHYRSPTAGGSSGSPVLTRELKLLAVHHRTRKALQANEGVLLEPIAAEASDQ